MVIPKKWKSLRMNDCFELKYLDYYGCIFIIFFFQKIAGHHEFFDEVEVV